MAKTARKKDPRQEQLDEIAQAKKEGKTELSVNLQGPDDEVLAAAFDVTSLTKLRLGLGYEIKKIPLGIGKLVNLERLTLDGGALTELPADIGKLAKLEDLTSYSHKITEIPDSIGDLVSLEDLSLWSNQLTKIPESIGGLTKLKKLSFKWNQLTALPESIGKLVNLEELDLENNKLTDLPESFGNLKKLRELKLSNNALTTFPLPLTELVSLEMLLAKANQIASIPGEIVKMTKLRELNLAGNKLKDLPEAIFKTNISLLNLHENEIGSLSKTVGTMKSLIGILLTENPLAGITDEAVKGSKEALFEALGLAKPQEVTGDLPPEPELKAILKKRKESIEQFVRDTRRKLTDEAMRDRVVAFITGKESRVPPARLKDHYSFGHISEALAPYAEWTFIDRRILTFIARSAWHYNQPGHSYQTGYHDEFFRWLKDQMEKETDPGFFGKIVKELVARGLDEAALAEHALVDMSDKALQEDKKTPTSFGRWLLQKRNEPLFEELLKIAKESSGPRNALTSLLLAHDPPAFEKAAPYLLAIAPDSDGEIHIPYESLRTVCTKNPDAYEALLLDGLARTDCFPCRAEGVRILVETYGKKHGDKGFEMAAAILKEISERKNKGDRYEFPFSLGKRWDDGTPQFIGWMLAQFGEKARKHVFDYAENTKVYDLDVAEVVAKTIGQAGIDTIAEGLDMQITSDDIAAHYRRMFTILQPLDWSKYHDKAWEIARSEFRAVRETACIALARLDKKTVLPKAQELLDAKKGHEREAGVMILGLLGTPEAKEILEGIVDSETSDDARDLIVASLYEEPAKIGLDEVERRVATAKERGKLARPVAKWLDEKKLPAPSWAGKKKAKVSAETLRFLLHRQTRRTEIEIDPEARDVFALIDRESAGDLAVKLLALVMKNGGPSSKTRFALAVIGRLGDDRVIEKLEELAVTKQNVNAVATIGMLGTMQAARALDRIAKVYRTKYPNVRETAQEGFSAIADSLGKTPFELADAMLPDFGFKKRVQPLKAGKRKLTLVITGERKPGILDEDGELLKTPPKELSAKQKTELKELGAEIRSASRQLASSLEYYLIVGRRWSGADWTAFFVESALPFAFARGLVWGVYKGRKLEKAFRVNPEGDAAMQNGDDVVIARDASIGLVHPLELPEKERTEWQKTVMSDGATPAFPQMTRPVFAVAAEDKDKKLSYLFEGKEVNASTLKRRAERLGWRRGSVVDSGGVSAHKKTYTTDLIDVFMRHEGVHVTSMDFEAEATLQDFFFVKSGSVITGSYTYDEPRDESDERLIPFGKVPAIIWSETVADLHVIAGTNANEDEDDDE